MLHKKIRGTKSPCIFIQRVRGLFFNSLNIILSSLAKSQKFCLCQVNTLTNTLGGIGGKRDESHASTNHVEADAVAILGGNNFIPFHTCNLFLSEIARRLELPLASISSEAFKNIKHNKFPIGCIRGSLVFRCRLLFVKC